MNRDTEPGQGRKQRLLRELDTQGSDRPRGVAAIAAYVALALILAFAVLEARYGAGEMRVLSVVSGHAR